MPTSCRRMFALKRSSTPKSRHSRRDAAGDRQNQNMELPITLPADHPLRLGNFISAHLGTFESAFTRASGSHKTANRERPMTEMRTKFLFRLALEVGAHHVVGPTPVGDRRVPPISGGPDGSVTTIGIASRPLSEADYRAQLRPAGARIP